MLSPLLTGANEMGNRLLYIMHNRNGDARRRRLFRPGYNDGKAMKLPSSQFHICGTCALYRFAAMCGDDKGREMRASTIELARPMPCRFNIRPVRRSPALENAVRRSIAARAAGTGRFYPSACAYIFSSAIDIA